MPAALGYPPPAPAPGSLGSGGRGKRGIAAWAEGMVRVGWPKEAVRHAMESCDSPYKKARISQILCPLQPLENDLDVVANALGM